MNTINSKESEKSGATQPLKTTDKDRRTHEINLIFTKRPMSTATYNNIMTHVRRALNSILPQDRLLFLMFFLDKHMHGDMDGIICNFDDNEKNRIVLALVSYDDIYNDGYENEFTVDKYNDFESKLSKIEENPKNVKSILLKKEREIKKEKDKVTIVFLNIILEITFTPTMDLLHFKHVLYSFSAAIIIGKIITRDLNLAIHPNGLRIKTRITKMENSKEEHSPPPLLLTDNLTISDYKLYYKGVVVPYGDYIELILSTNIEEVFTYLSYGEDEKPKLTLPEFYEFQNLTEKDAAKFYQRINGFDSGLFKKIEEKESTSKRLFAVKSMVISEDYIKENEKPRMFDIRGTIRFFNKEHAIETLVENFISREKHIDPIDIKIGCDNIKKILVKHGYDESDVNKVMSNFPKKYSSERIVFNEEVNRIDGDDLEKFILYHKDIINPKKNESISSKKQKTKSLLPVILAETSDEPIFLKEISVFENTGVENINNDSTKKSMDDDVLDIV